MPGISDQIRRHSVALIGLAVALSSLGYNTWRNEQTEANRNIRTAGIEVLTKLGDLDRIVLHAPFGAKGDSADATHMLARTGRAYVLTIRDLGSLTPAPSSESSAQLFEIWRSNESGLGGNAEASFNAISSGIDQTRPDTLTVLRMLD